MKTTPWSFFTLFVLLLFSTVSAADGVPQRYFSMNLHCAVGDWQKRLDKVADEIARFRPEVMGFQEVCKGENVDTGAYLRAAIESRGVEIRFWKTADTHTSFVKYQEQLMLLSTHPVVSDSEGTLPSMPFLRNKYISADLGELTLVVTHFHFLFPTIRLRQYAALTKLFSNTPAIVMGDFNSGPSKRESKPFRKAGWASVFPGPTFPSSKPTKIFDGFWFSPALEEWSKQSEASVVLGDDPDPASDHLGIILQTADCLGKSGD